MQEYIKIIQCFVNSLKSFLWHLVLDYLKRFENYLTKLLRKEIQVEIFFRSDSSRNNFLPVFPIYSIPDCIIVNPIFIG